MREKTWTSAERVRLAPAFTIAAWGLGALSGEALPASPPHAAAPEGRTIDWMERRGPLLADLKAVRAAALAWMPEGLSQAPLDLDLGEPVRIGGQTWLNGKYTFSGVEVGGPGLAMLFDQDERLVAIVRPTFDPQVLLSAPPRGGIDLAEAASIARARAGAGMDVRVDPMRCDLEDGRFVYPAVFARPWDETRPLDGPEDWTTHGILIDAASGEIVFEEQFAIESRIDGTCTGRSFDHSGPGVRSAGDADADAPERRLPFIPLRCMEAGWNESLRTTTAGDGSFELELRGSGLWGIETSFDTDDFTLVAMPGARTAGLSRTGAGCTSHVDLLLEPDDPAADAVGRENEAGLCAGWIYLHIAKQLAEEIADLFLDWPAGFGGKSPFVRGYPAFYNIRFFRFAVPNGVIPFAAGWYQDGIDPDDRRIGIAEGNDLFHDWVKPALFHEFGHAVVSAYTGVPNATVRWRHDPAINEGLADFFALLMMERRDPDHGIETMVGRGQQRGCPDSFQRDVEHARACLLGKDPGACCTPVDIGGIFPGGTEPHAGGLVIAGFFLDLWKLLRERHGPEEGFWRTAELFARYINCFRGNFIPPMDFVTVAEILLLADNPDAGGDNIPQNGAPDDDLILLAAAKHNLWLHRFTRGEVNGDQHVDIADPIRILRALFLGGAELTCLDAADADDNAVVDLSDAVHILRHLFLDGPPPAPPSACGGIDPTPFDRLTCVEPPCPRS